jgi:hypothetical protein
VAGIYKSLTFAFELLNAYPSIFINPSFKIICSKIPDPLDFPDWKKHKIR